MPALTVFILYVEAEPVIDELVVHPDLGSGPPEAAARA